MKAHRSGRAVWGESEGLRPRQPLVGIVSSNPAGGMDMCLFECFVLLGTSLSDGPIPSLEESYRLWRGIVCDLETSRVSVLASVELLNQGAKSTP